MPDRKWHRGPPPHIGWWNASAWRIKDVWRWWDGEQWSRFVGNSTSGELAMSLARQPAESQFGIEWSDYYPPNARVPRIDPRVNGAGHA